MRNILFGIAAPMLLTAISCTSVSQKTTSAETQKAKVDERIITIPNERTTSESKAGILYGKIYEPCDEERHPAVILSHGYNGCFTDFADDCLFFAENGFIAFSYDFAGGSMRSKSTGRTTDMTLQTEKQDLLTVIEYIRNLENVDANQLFLLGGSQGGLVTALAAEEEAEAIRAITLYYPAFCIPDDWRKQYPKGAKIPKTVDFWGLRLGKGFIESATALDVNEATGKYAKPVLIIHGTNDNIVQLSYAQAAQKNYQNAKLVVLPGEGHGFSPNGAAQARKMVLDYMQKILKTTEQNNNGN